MATGINYRPLSASKNEIRLLSIRQEPPSEGDLLEFHLEHASVANSWSTPIYIAVSYVWGDPSQRRDIIVDGEQVSVPENAEIALRNLHGAAVNHKDEAMLNKYRLWRFPDNVRFWIDSVCIDQSNLEERGQQVAIMWRVFSFALVVLIWLGAEDGKTAAAKEQIDSILQDCRQETDDFKELKQTLWINTVVQETILAKQAYCIKGKHMISWTSIGRAAQWLRYKGYFQRNNLNRLLYGLSNASRIQDYKDNFANMEDIFMDAYLLDASDPRDKVFGFLGAFQALNCGTAILQALMPPDYSAKVGDVYAKITKALIESRHDLGTFFTVQHAKRLSKMDALDIPTWALLLHLELGHNSTDYYEAKPLSLATTGLGSCNGLPLHLDVANEDYYTLRLKGCVIDEVVIRAGQALRWESLEGLKTLIIQSYEPGTAYALSSQDAFGRTMVLDSRVRPDIAACSLADWPSFLQWCRGTGEVNDVARYYGEFLKDSCWLRRFFVTRNGFIGMGTHDIREGDAVCILFGGQVPYTLRPAKDGSDTSTFVGDAYVDGIMDGEYVQRLQNEGRLDAETRWFSLR